MQRCHKVGLWGVEIWLTSLNKIVEDQLSDNNKNWMDVDWKMKSTK